MRGRSFQSVIAVSDSFEMISLHDERHLIATTIKCLAWFLPRRLPAYSMQQVQPKLFPLLSLIGAKAPLLLTLSPLTVRPRFD